MKKLLLAILLLAVGCGDTGPIRYDTSSPEAIQASTEAMMEGMTDAEKAALTRDIMEFSMAAMSDLDNLTSNPLEKLDGLTAEEIHVLAEQVRAKK